MVNKPPGLVVHPAPGNWSGTLLNGLLAHHAGASQVPRAGIVHRLDKDTSGLMVVAKPAPRSDALVALIAARHVSRRYVALAHGAWRGAPLHDRGCGHWPRPAPAPAHGGGRSGPAPGQTGTHRITCLDSTDRHCLVHCKLHTGRTHQIGVHMLSLQHPLVADALLRRRRAEGGLQRQALHAFRLGLQHPVTGAAMQWRAARRRFFAGGSKNLGLAFNPPLKLAHGPATTCP